jgi:flagellar basal body P-ring formation protein FlgA
MRSFASVLAGLLTLAGAALAQAPAAQSDGGGAGQEAPTRSSALPAPAPATPAIPARLVQRVVADIAQQWGADTAGLELVWGHVPLAGTFPPKTDVRVVGRGDGGWFVAVFDPGSTGPFAVRVRAGARDSALVAARMVESGRTLTAEDLRVVPRIRWGPPSDPATPAIGVGWVTRYPLMAGVAVTSGSVSPPPLVHAGDPVRLEWQRGAVLITLDGTALQAGAAGQTIRVRVGQNRGDKSGTVLATGIVRLDL